MTELLREEIAGRSLEIETGRLAGQADGAVAVRYGDTVVLVTACASPKLTTADFLPLTVDYEERLYAAGKIPGSFFRREGRPSQEATVTARLTDRAIRPLFPQGFRHETQVVIAVLSADRENDPDILGLIGAATALGISSIPFLGPIAATRIGLLDGRLVVNPASSELTSSQLDLVVASTRGTLVMIEAAAKEVSEEQAVEAMKLAFAENLKVIELQERLIRAVGKPKMAGEAPSSPPGLEASLLELLGERLTTLVSASRGERVDFQEPLIEELKSRLGDAYPASDIPAALERVLKKELRRRILEGRRPDGRGWRDIRPISCEVGCLPRTHGSGLFTRGDTQVLTITTLGSIGEEQLLDGLGPEETKRFIHHYNFPPFSTGEVKRIGIPTRREIGHGALAERALLPVIPDEETFPYTLRLVSEVLSSSGSTSMASVCGSSLSLMDAGVPIKAPVAGIAMGLVTEGDRYAILTDIAGVEDAYGDMDFKVAGTGQGLTALQLDIKLQGIGLNLAEEALRQAREARLYILEKIRETIPQSRTQLSRYAPRILRMKINPDKIGAVIGPGGKTIRSIIEETKATIDVEDDGTVFIGSPSEEAALKAVERIQALTREVQVGSIYTGKVIKLMPYGAFVQILPGQDGLVHISELADYRVPRVEDVVKVGDEIMVMVTEIDRQGKIHLSRKRAYQGQTPEAPAGETREEAPPRSARDIPKPGERRPSLWRR